VIGCDGNRSMVRERLGIATVGLGDLVHSMSITLRCDISEALRGRPLSFAWVRRPGIDGFLSWSTDLASVALSIAYDPTDEEDAGRFTPENCHSIAAACLRLPPERIEVVDIHPWCLSSWSADSFRKGSVFLAGDAIHSTPPLGGFGANTGIHDAHNLALKLVSVIRDSAPDALLDLYEAERGPVVRMVVAQATARLARRSDVELPLEAMQPVLDEETISMGYRYPILPRAGDVPNPIAIHPGELRAEPGTRAPHVWLRRDGVRISSLDLFGDGLVLLAGEDAAGWSGEAVTSLRRLGISASRIVVGQDVDDPEAAFPAAYGVSNNGVVLVRADGFVLWKAARTETFSETEFLTVLVDAREVTAPVG